MNKFIIFIMLVFSAVAHAETGKIKVCRNASITNSADGKFIKFPALNYVGACDKSGENCREIIVNAEAGSVGKERGACAILSANLKQSDGKPLKAGTPLLASFSSTDDFENQGYSKFSETFVGDAKITVISDFK